MLAKTSGVSFSYILNLIGQEPEPLRHIYNYSFCELQLNAVYFADCAVLLASSIVRKQNSTGNRIDVHVPHNVPIMYILCYFT